MSRERFEELFEVPEWAGFDPVHGYSNPEWRPVANLTRLDELCRINAAWHAYQSRQPEIDELVEALEGLHAEAKWLFRQAERGDITTGKSYDTPEARRAIALIAKHKGE